MDAQPMASTIGAKLQRCADDAETYKAVEYVALQGCVCVCVMTVCVGGVMRRSSLDFSATM